MATISNAGLPAELFEDAMAEYQERPRCEIWEPSELEQRRASQVAKLGEELRKPYERKWES